ncbi:MULTISPECIES: sensor histidine kinase efflux regulator BaeS [Pseudomonas]|uniref:sensor histidine kinase efflux regulator BaeS n=1 Tax=Pseudomonas TaxID=286 RepID=UPI00398FE5C6
MILRITHKLFLAVLAATLCVVLAMGFAAHASFTSGFLGYLNEQALERMESVLPRMTEAYREHGSWNFLLNNPDAMFVLLMPAGVTVADMKGGHFRSPVSDLTGAHLRFSLLDANKTFLMGYREAGVDAVLRPIDVDGHTVGWLSLAPFQSVTGEGDLRFQQHQVRATLWSGAAALLFAIVIAWWIARSLLAPVQRVAAATHRLAAGDYHTRVEASSADEVGQLARDFNHLALALENTERQRRDFMADVSHELRTPLSVLRGELEALEDGVRQMSPESVRSLLGEVATLSKLVDDLYELSLADVGALAYRKVDIDLAALLRDTAQVFGERCQEHGLQLQLAIPPWPLSLQADPLRLQQLFNNLLENAVRYTDTGGVLQLGVERRSGVLSITFADSAPGVLPEHLPHLFERFFRVETSRSRASGGAGLGLSICKAIALAHGGQIHAEPSALGGLLVTIKLPEVR